MLESKDISLLTRICIVKAMVFPVVTYSYESWTIKKAECQITDAFKLWCWKRLESPTKIKPHTESRQKEARLPRRRGTGEASGQEQEEDEWKGRAALCNHAASCGCRNTGNIVKAKGCVSSLI